MEKQKSKRNPQTAEVFDRIKDARTIHREIIEKILTDFSKKSEAVEKKFAPYRESEKLIRDGIGELIQPTRQNITKTCIEFGDILNRAADSLENELVCEIAKPCSAQFLQALRQYTEFGLVPGKTETEALLYLTDGNIVPQKILYHTLQQLKAPYTFQPRTVDEMERNLAQLRQLASVAKNGPTFPLEYLHEANVIFSDYGEDHVAVNGEDGQYTVTHPYIEAEPILDENGMVLGKWNLDSLTAQAGQFDGLSAAIDEMESAWVTPEKYPDLQEMTYPASGSTDQNTQNIVNSYER